MTSLNKTQATVLSFLFEKLPISEEINTLDFSLAGNFCGKYFGAFADIQGDEENTKVAFTLPTYTGNVFLALTRSNEQEVVRILANIEDYEREHSLELNIGEVVVIPKIQIKDDDPFYAMLLLRTAIYDKLTRVPDRQLIDDREIKFSLVIPISKTEFDYRKKFGHDALMDDFQTKGKDIFFYQSKGAGSH